MGGAKNTTFLLAQDWRLVDQVTTLIHKDIIEPTSGPDNIDSLWKNMYTEQDQRIPDIEDRLLKSTIQ